MLLRLAEGAVLLFLAKATIILVGALLATLVMQRASAGSRHLVWLVTLGTLLLVPALTAWGPIRLAVLPPEQKAAVQRFVTPPELAPAPGTGTATPSASSRVDAQVDPAVQDAVQQRVQDGSLLGAFWRGAFATIALAVMVWALVALAIVAVLLRDALVLGRIVRSSTPLDSPEWRDMLWEIADRLELPDVPRLLRSDDSKMPFACGVRHATIVLPAECDDWSIARRRAVLLHELAHVRRHDLIGHMLGRLACAVYWFHPLVWTAAKQLRAESERACDDLALGCGTQASDYAEHLLDIVTSVRRASTPTVALAMARRKEFEGRMLAILDPDVPRGAPKRWQAGALVASLAAMAVLVGAATPAHRPAQHIVLAPAMRPTIPSGETGALGSPSRASGQSARTAMTDAPPVPPTLTSISRGVANGVATSVANDVANRVAKDVAGNVAGNVASGVANGVVGGLPPGNSAAMPQAIGQIASAVVSQVTTGLFGPAQASGTPEERAALLIKVLQTDTSAEVRRTAAWGLAQLARVPAAANALAAALQHDSDAGVRANAAWGLGQSSHGSTVVRDALVAALGHDANAKVRSQAAWSLGALSAQGAVAALATALHDSDEKVRSEAAWAIGAIAPRQAPQAVMDALRDPNEHVRANAAWALFTIHDRAAAPALNAAFQHETSERVQQSEIEALGMMGDAGLPAIRAALNSSNPRVKRAAVDALSMHFDPDPDPNPDPNP